MFLELYQTLQLFIYCNCISWMISLLAPINVYATQMPQSNVFTMNLAGSSSPSDSGGQPLPQQILWTTTTPPPPLPPGVDIGALMASMPIMPAPESMNTSIQEAMPNPNQMNPPWALAGPENGTTDVNQMMMNAQNISMPNAATSEVMPATNPESLQVQPSAYFSISASSFAQRFFLNKEGWPPFITMTAHGSADIEKTITLSERFLSVRTVKFGLNFSATADQASFVTSSPVIGGTYLNVQCMTEEEWLIYNLQIGNTSDAHDQVAETASSMMPTNSLSSAPFFCTQGCPTSLYLLGGSGSANKLVIIFTPQLAKLWAPLGKFLLKTSVSYAINSRSYGSNPLSTMVNPRYCVPSANPSLTAWNIESWKEAAAQLPTYKPQNQQGEEAALPNSSIAPPTQYSNYYLNDLSSADTKHIFSFGISLQYLFNDSFSLAGDFGLVKSEAVPDMPHAGTRYIDDTQPDPPIRFCTPKSDYTMPFKDLLTQIHARNVLGYKCGIKLNTPIAQIALSYLDNGQSLLNKCVKGNNGKSIEACVVFPLPNNIKLGISAIYIFRKLQCLDPSSYKADTGFTRFSTIAISANISGQINLFSVTLSIDYVQTWQTLPSAAQSSIAATWPENTWPAIPKPNEGVGITLSIQAPLS